MNGQWHETQTRLHADSGVDVSVHFNSMETLGINSKSIKSNIVATRTTRERSEQLRCKGQPCNYIGVVDVNNSKKW